MKQVLACSCSNVSNPVTGLEGFFLMVFGVDMLLSFRTAYYEGEAVVRPGADKADATWGCRGAQICLDGSVDSVIQRRDRVVHLNRFGTLSRIGRSPHGSGLKRRWKTQAR